MKQQIKEVMKDEFALDAIEIVAAPPKKNAISVCYDMGCAYFLPVDGLVSLRGCPLKCLCRYGAREIWFLHFNAF